MDDDGGKAWRWRGMVAERILQPQSPFIGSRLVAGNGTRFEDVLFGARGRKVPWPREIIIEAL